MESVKGFAGFFSIQSAADAARLRSIICEGHAFTVQLSSFRIYEYINTYRFEKIMEGYNTASL